MSCTNNRSRMFFFFFVVVIVYQPYLYLLNFCWALFACTHTARKNVFRVIGKRVNAKKQHFLCTFSVLCHVCALSMSYQNICPIRLVFVMRCLEDFFLFISFYFQFLSIFFVCSKKPNGAFYFNFRKELSIFSAHCI